VRGEVAEDMGGTGRGGGDVRERGGDGVEVDIEMLIEFNRV